MNKEAAQKWVDELIFGNHPQTLDGNLLDDNGYCGLGVACLVYAKENDLEVENVVDDDLEYGYLPVAVQRWLGTDHAFETEIITMNDTEEVPLADIGVFIRDHYLKDE